MEERSDWDGGTAGRGPDGIRRESASDDTAEASFLSKYFRDMAALDVLKPDEEFDAARGIEAREIAVWESCFSYPPIVGYLIGMIESRMDNSIREFRSLRRAAEHARKSKSLQAREGLRKAAESCASRVHALDVDRQYQKAVLDELERVASGAPGEFPGQAPRFPRSSQRFQSYLREVRTAERTAANARHGFVLANLRLVVSIARRFNYGRMSLPDLIQEGNIGLMKAVDRYDYRRGFRFSTYASWWIRHAINRALADKGREVRLPVHLIDAHYKLSKAKRELIAKLGRAPTNEELAHATLIPADKIEQMRGHLVEGSHSFDRPSNDEDGRSLAESLEDPGFSTEGLTESLHQHALAQAVRGALSALKPIEAEILRQRFGLDEHDEHTLKEIGVKFNLSRERIRQLQEEALAKVREVMQEMSLSLS